MLPLFSAAMSETHHGPNPRPSHDNPSAMLSFAQNEQHQCSFCGKGFSSFQSLGGHMTYHRKEITTLRRNHEEFMERHRAHQIHEEDPNHRRSLPMIQLAPNCSFWKAYRKGGPRPQLVNYFKKRSNHHHHHHHHQGRVSVLQATAGNEGTKNFYEENIIDAAMKLGMRRENPNEGSSSLGLDLNLEL